MLKTCSFFTLQNPSLIPQLTILQFRQKFQAIKRKRIFRNTVSFLNKKIIKRQIYPSYVCSVVSSEALVLKITGKIPENSIVFQNPYSSIAQLDILTFCKRRSNKLLITKNFKVTKRM